MAKQAGPLFITGTIDGIIFYKLDGQYLMRSKGSYKSGKQMRKDARLKRTLQNADRFGEASSMVKYNYYRYVPRAARRHGLFGELTGMVNRWLYQGQSGEEAEALLIAYCQTLQTKTKATSTADKALTPAYNTSLSENRSTVAVIATPQSPSVSTHKHHCKKARYLSRGRVKRNERLHQPKARHIPFPTSTTAILFDSR